MGIWDARRGFQEIRASAFDVEEEVLARAVAAPRTDSAHVV
jgi:hypothetical protein